LELALISIWSTGEKREKQKVHQKKEKSSFWIIIKNKYPKMIQRFI
jgi:hypothetical protein